MDFLYNWIPAADPNTLDAVSLLLFISTLISSAAFSAMYYLLINNWRLGFHRIGHWIVTMVFNGILVLAVSISLGMNHYGIFAPFLGLIGLWNLIMSAGFFYGFSFIFKRFSKLASKVPH
jgi:hypothetical protein